MKMYQESRSWKEICKEAEDLRKFILAKNLCVVVFFCFEARKGTFMCTHVWPQKNDSQIITNNCLFQDPNTWKITDKIKSNCEKFEMLLFLLVLVLRIRARAYREITRKRMTLFSLQKPHAIFQGVAELFKFKRWVGVQKPLHFGSEFMGASCRERKLGGNKRGGMTKNK